MAKGATVMPRDLLSAHQVLTLLGPWPPFLSEIALLPDLPKGSLWFDPPAHADDLPAFPPLHEQS